MPKIYLERKPEHGRANTELINRLEEVLGERPVVISGHHSRRRSLRS